MLHFVVQIVFNLVICGRSLSMGTVVNTLQLHFWKYLVLLVGCYVAFRLGKPYLVAVYKIAYAWVLDHFQKTVNESLGEQKMRLFSDMQDTAEQLGRPLRVLEIGAGSGGNLKYFPHGTQVEFLEPNPHFRHYMEQNAERNAHVTVLGVVVGYAEDMKAAGIKDESVDAVVCTHTMCTVQDVDQCLREIKRVLRPVSLYKREKSYTPC